MRKSCCKTYEVPVDRREQAAIVGAMPYAARYARLYEDGELIDPFDESSDGHPCLNTHEDGMCVFAWRRRDGAVLCSLHSAALDLGLPPAAVKPKACVLWPLLLQETDPPLLTVQDGVAQFRCNALRRRFDQPLDPGVAGIVRAVFGPEFLAQLEFAIDSSTVSHRKFDPE